MSTGEEWDPEASWSSSCAERESQGSLNSAWLNSLGFPEEWSLLAPISRIVPPTRIYSNREWKVHSFCEAAYALMCFTKIEGLSGEENASLNAAAASCALRELLPYSPSAYWVQPLLTLMAATQGVNAFASEVADLLEWLHEHSRARYMRGFLMACAANINQVSTDAASSITSKDPTEAISQDVQQRLQDVCAAIVSEQDPYVGRDEVNPSQAFVFA